MAPTNIFQKYWAIGFESIPQCAIYSAFRYLRKHRTKCSHEVLIEIGRIKKGGEKDEDATTNN